MSEQGPSKLPDESYEATDIERTIAALPPEVQQMVRDGIVNAKQERKNAHEALQFKSYIAEFAIALHITSSVDLDNYPAHVNTINWSRLTWDLSEMVIRYAAKDLPVELPDSLKKAVAYNYASNEFVRGTECDEIDELLVPFGYPTEQILDEVMDEIMEEGGNNGMSREAVKEKLLANLWGVELWDNIDELEPAVRQDLINLGYQLPELESDNSYGYSPEEGEKFPNVTPGMLPT